MRGDAFARQLRLLALLEGRPEGLAPDEAAEEIGARRRTIYRDFRVLEDAGFPLTTLRDGRHARWRMMPGFRHRLQLSLTWSELVGLLAARKLASGLNGTLLHDSAASALEKIRATLPKGLADRFRSADRLVSAQAGGRDYRSRADTVRNLLSAVDSRRTVVARYRSRGATRPTQRRLDPYHLRIAEEGIYVLARCHRDGEVKLFLADRFDALELTDEEFAVPPSFNADEILRPSFAMWNGPARAVRFTVAPGPARLLLERKLHPSQISQHRSDGSVEVEMQAAIGPPLVAYLVGLGPALTEVSPASLRQAVSRAHRMAAAGLGEHASRDVTPAAYGWTKKRVGRPTPGIRQTENGDKR